MLQHTIENKNEHIPVRNGASWNLRQVLRGICNIVLLAPTLFGFKGTGQSIRITVSLQISITNQWR